jgi:hypothetical protein
MSYVHFGSTATLDDRAEYGEQSFANREPVAPA